MQCTSRASSLLFVANSSHSTVIAQTFAYSSSADDSVTMVFFSIEIIHLRSSPISSIMQKKIRTMILLERRQMSNILSFQGHLQCEPLNLFPLYIKRIKYSCQSFLEFANLCSERVILSCLLLQVVTRLSEIFSKPYFGICMRLWRFHKLL